MCINLSLLHAPGRVTDGGGGHGTPLLLQSPARVDGCALHGRTAAPVTMQPARQPGAETQNCGRDQAEPAPLGAGASSSLCNPWTQPRDSSTGQGRLQASRPQRSLHGPCSCDPHAVLEPPSLLMLAP